MTKNNRYIINVEDCLKIECNVAKMQCDSDYCHGIGQKGMCGCCLLCEYKECNSYKIVNKEIEPLRLFMFRNKYGYDKKSSH